MLPKVSLVLGGADSGKSVWAEKLVSGYGLDRVYLATGSARDREMAERIARHRARRGDGWRTLEEPLDPGVLLRGAGAGEAVLLDCATLWLANLLDAGRDPGAAATALVGDLAACAAPVVVVSNETGLGIVPDNSLSRRFRTEQGRLNQQLAAAADLAVFVMAGLPLALKGQVPEWMR